MSLSQLQGIMKDREAGVLQFMGSKKLDMTWRLNNGLIAVTCEAESFPKPTTSAGTLQRASHVLLMPRWSNGFMMSSASSHWEFRPRRRARVSQSPSPCRVLGFPSLPKRVWTSQVVLVVRNLSINAGDLRDMGLIPGSGRSPGGGHGNPLQYSCLQNPMDRGAWWTTVHGVTKSQTWLKWLSTHAGKESSSVLPPESHPCSPPISQ